MFTNGVFNVGVLLSKRRLQCWAQAREERQRKGEKKNNKDPVLQVAMDRDADAHEKLNKRVGRPRFKWTNEAMSKAWEKANSLEHQGDPAR